MHLEITLFESERLYVRPFTLEDRTDFFELNGNAEVMRYIRKAKTKEESDEFLKYNLGFYQQYPGLGRFAVYTKTEVQFIGSFSLLHLDDTGDFHLGYALLSSFHGKGFATELVKNSIDYVFQTIQKEKVIAITLPANIASQKVLLRSGFLLTGVTMHDGEEVMVFELQKLS